MRDIGTDRRRYLARQIEQVRDSEGSIHEIIVKVKSEGVRDDRFMMTVAEALKRRGLSSSARDCLPVTRDVLDPNIKGGSRALRSADRSLAAMIAQANVDPEPTAKRSSISALNKFLKSAVVQRAQATKESAREGMAPLGDRRPPDVQPVSFWPANSALIQVHSDDLDRLVDERPEIEDIFLNQRLSTPPLVSPRTIRSRRTRSAAGGCA